ncbi:hypothetical protein FC10_GL001068 [Lactobacillus delbrueckii subsp. lactis DSM 20072]|nr:tRNA pseudouridine synthase B [Lactobacillus delbrueckii subsp. lactis DSM 20072]KRK66100.1 hypothetical protein FC10_GL001068 [Lactobacillus delbrueckii subsp. lactis DSM 20072]
MALESAFGGFGEASAISLTTFMTEPSKTLSSPARLGTGLIPLEAFLEQGH